MSEYKIMDHYLVFKELGSDSIGVNYRAGEIEDDKAVNHKMLTVVHPFLAKNPAIWKRIKILLEGIKKSNIPNLFSPEKIEVREDKTTLVYPFLKGKTFEQVLEDATQQNAGINFDLAFSIALAVADLIDNGSSIVVSGQKSFHGFLTPDNIIIDYDGKIFLKNYGIYPYIAQDEEIFSKMMDKYGAWLAPEFIRKEKPIAQSDIYHLGYIIYRMLTGNYFSCMPDEDFDEKLSNISFTYHIDVSDKEFLTNIIDFFRKTLNPDPGQRFANIREFKDFVSSHFRIEELSSVTFSLAYFMNSLYGDTAEEEEQELQGELAYRLPRGKTEEERKKDDVLIENILIGLEEKERAKSKTMLIAVAVAAVIIVVAIFFYINMNKTRKAEQEQITQAKLQEEQLKAQLKEMEDKYRRQIQQIEEKITTTEEEKKAKEAQLAKFQDEWQKQKDKEMERLKKLEEERKQKEAEKEKQRLAALEQKKAETPPEQPVKTTPAETRPAPIKEEPKKLQAGALLPLSEVAVKPVKVAGKNPKPTYLMGRKYAGRSIDVLASILVDENGAVSRVKILGDAPSDIAGRIKKTVGTWKYEPASKDGVKVKVWIQKRFNFKFK